MKIENIKISEIKPYLKNAKKHEAKQIDAVAKSIKRFGWASPVVIDKNNELIIGHCRILAAQKLGIAEVPTLRMEGLSDDEVKALRLADNKLNESDWDMGLAIEELKGLSDEMFDLTGFDKDLLIEPDDQDDVIPEVKESKSKLGDLYELGKHRLLCGDSTKREDVERLMGGRKADMVFTDPPYGINLTPKKNYALRKQNKKSEDYEKIIGDDVEFDMSKIFENIDCKKWWVWGADYLYKTIPNFRNGNLVVWAKRHSESENKVFGSAFELCWVYPYCKKEIWFIRAINQSNEAMHIHPTQKPTELGVRAISRNTEEGNIILDLFLGSGSTLIAAEKTNRICYGMELDPHYVDVIVQRYVDYTGNENIILNGEKIVWTKTQT